MSGELVFAPASRAQEQYLQSDADITFTGALQGQVSPFAFLVHS
jgi:hypothetical protein